MMVTKILPLVHQCTVERMAKERSSFSMEAETSSLVRVYSQVKSNVFKDQIISIDHYQIIQAEKVQVGSGFGYSLSKEIIDIDQNGNDDFAVGAPFDNSASAVVLRSKPVIGFKPGVRFPGRESSIDPKTGGKFLFSVTSNVLTCSMHFQSLN